MTFSDYLNASWRDHADHPEKVLSGFRSHFHLCESQNDVMALGNLIFHVCGEHLGKWSEGQGLLQELKSVKPLDDEKGFNRFIHALKLCSDKNTSMNGLSESDLARIYAISASALASHNDLERSGNYLKRAEQIAREKLAAGDPAIKSLAITGWNLSCALEEKPTRTDIEKELMKLAAHISRDYWEKAGTWLEVERGEYRLANTYLKASEPQVAMKHAENCLNIIKKNEGDPLEFFFAYEVLAHCWSALGDQTRSENAIHQMEKVFSSLSEDDQKWTKASLEKVKAI